jgi:hypothetical protein
MRVADFALDFLDGVTFKGYTKGETWNVFACPYFSFEQAQRIVSAWRGKGWAARYDAETDAFMFEVNAESKSSDFEGYSGINIKKQKFYRVGAFSWIWDEI